MPRVGAAMAGRGPLGGLASYTGWLLSAIIVPLAWVRAMKVAKRHTDTDPKAPMKAVVGIIVGVLLFGFLAVQVLSFEQENTAGIYDSLDGRLAVAIGENAYQEALESGGDAEALEPNHALYEQVSAAVQAHDDERAKQLIASRGSVDHPDLDAKADRAFEIKDDSVDTMRLTLWVFVYPGLIGALYAPLVFAMGNILKSAWTPSDSVGFKPYPGASAGWFLLLGAFGVPALPFAAWVLKDIGDRSAEGQIAL